MATKRITRKRARRANPVKTTGMILVNPRPRGKRKAKSRARVTRKTNPSAKRRSSVKRRSTRRANPRTARRRVSRRRVNGARRRRVSTRSRSRSRSRRSNPKRRVSRRRNGGAPIVVRRKNGVRRSRRRSNGGRRSNPAGMLARIPLIGPILAHAIGLAPIAAIGAFTVEPVMAIVKLAAPYMPMMPASGFYAIAGLLFASLIPMIPFGSLEFRKKVALAAASAAGGVAWYKMRTGQDTEVITEAVVVEMAGAGFGGLIPGPSSGFYQPPPPVNAQFSGAGYGVPGGGAWSVQPSGVGGAY